MLKKIILITILFAFAATGRVHAAPVNILHEFAGGADDGDSPNRGGLAIDSGKLYGTTRWGGDSNLGVLYSMDTDGTNFALMHEFDGGALGSQPYGGPIISSGKAYVLTNNGGSNNLGAVFAMELDGSLKSGYVSFSGGGGLWPGSHPRGSLYEDSGTLYGMTYDGGPGFSRGVVFSMGTTGQNYTILHDFEGGINDGSYPWGDVIAASGKLYGMTYGGGNAIGTVFSMDTDGSNFSILHSFAGGVDGGRYPEGSLVENGGVLYGMTRYGGDSNRGVIFSMNTDGSNFTLLHEFAGGTDDGAYPFGTLALINGELYGMTSNGGDANLGTMFVINIDGTDYMLLHEFLGGADDGSRPYGDLLIDSGMVYGMTMYGGDSNKGIIFSQAITSAPELPPAMLHFLVLILGGRALFKFRS